MKRVFLGPDNIVSPLGFSTKENFEAVLEGRIGVMKQKFPFSDGTFCCGRIDRKKLNEKFSSKHKSSDFTDLEKMCILSINDVLDQSKMSLSDKRSLLLISTTKGNIDVLEKSSDVTGSGREYLPALAEVLSQEFSCASTPLVLSNACISGLLAIIIAKRFIDQGLYDNIVVCGADLVTEFTLSGFKSFNALSEENCRPFDAARKGINLGEAAASILITNQTISDIIISAGASANDANHISGPSRTGDGLYQALSQTLQTAGRKNADFICAHGTATEYNDEMESVAFSRLYLDQLPVNSLKGFYGHTLGAAGVLETIISIQSLKNNVLLKSPGFETKGTTHLNNVIRENKKQNLQSCLKTASGFGGCNAAALFEKIA